MKKQFLLFGIVLLLIAASPSFAQSRLGVYLGYGSEIESAGLGVNAEFHLSEKVAIAPGLTYFFPKSYGWGKFNWFEFNANVNYYFLQEDVVNLYGLGGLNFTSVKWKYEGGAFGDRTDSHTELGLNLGLGANFDVGQNFMPFGELKFVVGDADQVCLFFGLKFNLN